MSNEDSIEALNMGLEWAESEDPKKRANADGLIDLGLKLAIVEKAQDILAKPLGENNAPNPPAP